MTTPPDGLLALLHRPSPCFIATTMPDGSPHLTPTWVDTDGDYILINTVQGYRKMKNIQRDPRVAVSVLDPDDTSRYSAVRGHVIDATTDGAAEHIETLAHTYFGGPYPWYGGRDQTCVKLTIHVDKIVHTPDW